MEQENTGASASAIVQHTASGGAASAAAGVSQDAADTALTPSQNNNNKIDFNDPNNHILGYGYMDDDPPKSASEEEEEEGGSEPAPVVSEEAKAAQKLAIHRLGSAIAHVDDPFFCKGEIKLRSTEKIELSLKDKALQNVPPITITLPGSFLKDDEGLSAYRNNLWSWSIEDSRAKIASCSLTPQFERAIYRAFEVSPYGRGSETLVDERVRKAVQVKADRIMSTGIDLEKLGILEAVRSGLVPWASRIHASLDKLNVYPAGGHFKPHKDTPRDELAFGTLVVALPSKFYGGNLKVRHRGRENTCDWGKRLMTEEDDFRCSIYWTLIKSAAPIIQWCAFFGDWEHEIDKVTDGYRVTLTYILRYEPADQGIAKHMAAALGPIAPLPKVSEWRTSTTATSQADYLDLKEYVEDMTLAELKDECRRCKFKVTGTKEMLKTRLMGLENANKKGKKGASQHSAIPDVGTYAPSLAASLGAQLHSELKAALENKDFLSQGGILGVPCMHLYEQDAELPPLPEDHVGGNFDPEKAIQDANSQDVISSNAGAEGTPIKARDLRLKGADALIYMCAARLGLRPVVLRLVWDNENQYSLKELPSLRSAYDWCKPSVVESHMAVLTLYPRNSIGKEDQGPLAGENEQYEAALDTKHVAWVDIPPFARGKQWANKAGEGSLAPAATLLPQIYTSTSGYFGNEGGSSTFYAAAAIIFTVPSIESTGRAATLLKASQALGTPAASSASSTGSSSNAGGRSSGASTAQAAWSGQQHASSAPSSSPLQSTPRTNSTNHTDNARQNRTADTTRSAPPTSHSSSSNKRQRIDANSSPRTSPSQDNSSQPPMRNGQMPLGGGGSAGAGSVGSAGPSASRDGLLMNGQRQQASGPRTEEGTGSRTNPGTQTANGSQANGSGRRSADDLPKVVDPEAFVGLRRGLDAAAEESAWHKYWQAWKKGKPDIPRHMAVELAQKYKVSAEGTTAHIVARVEKAAGRVRWSELRAVMKAQYREIDAMEFSELNMY